MNYPSDDWIPVKIVRRIIDQKQRNTYKLVEKGDIPSTDVNADKYGLPPNYLVYKPNLIPFLRMDIKRADNEFRRLSEHRSVMKKELEALERRYPNA